MRQAAVDTAKTHGQLKQLEKVYFTYTALQSQPLKTTDGRRVYEFSCCRKFYAAVSVFDGTIGTTREYYHDFNHPDEAVAPIKPKPSLC